MDSLKQDLERLNAENTLLEEEERAQRRNFLDGRPQQAIYGPPGLKTYDDKVLLAFWITYGAAIVTMILVATRGKAWNERVAIVMTTLVVAYGLAYYAITVYG